MSCVFTQSFGENKNNSYASSGLKGHTGKDIVCGYGTKIYPYKRIFVYKVLDGVDQKANDGSGFTGVFGIDEDGNEWLYGHCDTIAKEGQWYETDEAIGAESNHGTVFVGGTQITLEMQAAGDTRGHHRHNQKRVCIPVEKTEPGKKYLTSYAGGFAYINHRYYQIVAPDNGYNGCVDYPELFQEEPKPKDPPKPSKTALDTFIDIVRELLRRLFQ